MDQNETQHISQGNSIIEAFWECLRAEVPRIFILCCFTWIKALSSIFLITNFNNILMHCLKLFYLTFRGTINSFFSPFQLLIFCKWEKQSLRDISISEYLQHTWLMAISSLSWVSAEQSLWSTEHVLWLCEADLSVCQLWIYSFHMRSLRGSLKDPNRSPGDGKAIICKPEAVQVLLCGYGEDV